MTTYPDVIELNIGGTLFQTSKSTLIKRANWFKTQIEAGKSIQKDKSGTIFIDRSPRHFDLILSYLRDGFVQLPNTEQEVKEIRIEADFYEITGLVELCYKKLDVYDDVIKLDVGGTIFKTSKSTLTKFDGCFKTMLETGIPLEKNDSGAVFIDRPAKHFELILNFMRDGHVVAPDSKTEIEEIKIEAKFYQLKPLMNIGKTLREIYKKLNFLNCATGFFKPLPNDNPTIVINYDVENWNNVFRNIDVEEYVGTTTRVLFEDKEKVKIADGNWAFSIFYRNVNDWKEPQVYPVSEFFQKFNENLALFREKASLK